MFEHKIFQLSSGLEVLTISIQGFASVTSLIFANVGSRYEQKNEQGLAHFLEHMVFKGTKNYSSAKILAETLDALGAESNAFTSKEFTGFYVKTASVHLGLALDVLTDMIFLPKLEVKEIEKEKGVIIEEMKMYWDMPVRDIGNLFDRLLFTDQSLGHDVIGTKQTVLDFKRDDFLSFLKRWYYPANLSLILAGDSKVLKAQDLKNKLEKLVTQKTQDRQWPKKRVETEKLLGRPPLLKNKILVRTQSTQQIHLMLGWPALRRDDPRHYALSLLAIILGGNMSSRLFTEVREKRGLCYYVNAFPDYFQETGSLAVSAGVDKNRTHEAIGVILKECEDLASGKKPVGLEELQKACEYAVGSMLLSFEDSQTVAQAFGLRQLLLRKIENVEEVVKKLRAVSLSDVQTLAGNLMKRENLRLSLIGPMKNTDLKRYVAT